MSPGTRVTVIAGEHAGRSGVVADANAAMERVMRLLTESPTRQLILSKLVVRHGQVAVAFDSGLPRVIALAAVEPI